EIVKTAIEHGINLIDTAYSYGKGRSEELIGEVLKETRSRHEVILATKGAHRYRGDERIIDNSPEFLKEQVKNSLRRLQTDYIDIYYIHRPDENTPKYEAVGALKELKDEGYIRAIGISNFSLEEIKEANQDGYVDVVQDEYHLLNRSAEKELLPFLREQDIAFIPYYPLAAGILAGKYTPDMKFDDLRARLPYFQGEAFTRNLQKVEKLKEIASNHHIEVAQVVLAWYLTRDDIAAIIPGAKRPEQIAGNIRALDIRLSEEEINLIDEYFPVE
ncbi:MAG: aldo/keto reductase, partial [Caldibacillus sp.]